MGRSKRTVRTLIVRIDMDEWTANAMGHDSMDDGGLLAFVKEVIEDGLIGDARVTVTGIEHDEDCILLCREENCRRLHACRCSEESE